MTPKQWQKLQTIFEQALALPENQQQAFIESECKDDSVLLEQLKSMLEHADNDANPIAELIEQSATQILKREELRGKRLGAFELTNRIGQGGMGDVYQAQRVDGEFQQTVAIKVIRPEFVSEKISIRFQTERQILAKLNHPNIARIIDGGRFDGVHLYLVMEHIDGVPIDAYCQEHTLTQQQILTLFIKVCAAITYAHQNRVIHCDIKPSNILISEDGEPHLLDFGIATFIDIDASTEENDLSNNTIKAITWDYASPEQQSRQRLTTASDIYALGVLLYQLLLKKLPSLDNNQQFQKQLSELANQDLQMIITKTLSHNALDRFSSVDNLVADILNVRNKAPISIRLSDKKYVFTRFLQRNFIAASATVITLFALISFGYREYHLRHVAELAQIKAEQESTKAQQVVTLLTNIFKLSDPNIARGETVTAREILEKGRKDIDADLLKQPAIHSELLLTIAKVYENLGLYNEAKDVYLQNLTLVSEKLPNKTSLKFKILSQLGFVYIQLSQLPEAEKALNKALAHQASINHTNLSQLHNHLGLLHHEQGRPQKAIEYYQTALTLTVKNKSDSPESYLRVQHNLANSYIDAGQYQQATDLLKQILTAKEQHYGKDHQSYIRSLNAYVNMAAYIGIQDNTLLLAQEAVTLATSVLDESHPDVINAINTLANVFHELGEFSQAEIYYQQLIKLDEKYSGKNSVSYSVSVNNLASLYMDMELYELAEPLFRESLSIRKNLYANNHPRTARVIANLGKLFNKMERFDEAVSMNLRALSMLQSHDKKNAYLISNTLLKLFYSYLGQKNWPKASSTISQLTQALQSNFNSTHHLFDKLNVASRALKAAKNSY